MHTQELIQREKFAHDEAAPQEGSNANKKTQQQPQQSQKQDLAVVRAFVSLLGHIWSGEHKYSLQPRTLLGALRADSRCSMLFNSKQQDAHECLMLLLDIMHMDTNGMIQSERMHPKNLAADVFVKLPSPIEVQANTEDDEWSMVNNKNADVDSDPASEAQGLQGSECEVAGLQASDCESSSSVTDREYLCFFWCCCC
jgi:ubiquitin C-terminal hydrolase